MTGKILRPLLAIIAALLCIAALRWSAPVTFPIAAALLVVAAIWPLKQALDRFIPAPLGTAVAALALVAVVALFSMAIYISAAEVLAALSSHREQLLRSYQRLASFAAGEGVRLPSDGHGAAALLKQVASGGYSVTLLIGFVIVLAIFGLSEVRETRRKLREIIGVERRAELVDRAEEIASRVRQYLGVTFLLSLVTGGACALWAYAMGLELAVTWGLLNFLLNFIPIVGNIIGIIPPALYAFAQFGSIGHAFIILLGYAVIQILVSNFLNPWKQGRRLSLSPVVVLLALSFWGWVWGVGGALVAVPLTSAAVIICEAFEPTRWIARLLSRERPRRRKGGAAGRTREGRGLSPAAADERCETPTGNQPADHAPRPEQ